MSIKEEVYTPGIELASFTVYYLQILDQNGVIVNKEAEPDLSDDELTKYYKYMFLSREADERMLKLQRQGRIGTFPPGHGQEAIPVGVAMAMEHRDWFVDAYRTVGGRLLRGEKFSTILKLNAGFEEGYLDDSTHRTLPLNVVLGAQLPPAVGIAYGMRLTGEPDTCVVGFVGDGASSEGNAHEAMNFASVWQVPMIFMLVNNHWAISTPCKLQCNAKTFVQRAIAYDMPGVQVDGNDPLAVYVAMKDALDRGRAGGGPTLIEAVTYRMSLHTTADDPTRYRPNEEVAEWAAKDPIKRMKLYLEGRGIWDETKQAAMEEWINNFLQEGIEEFEAWIAKGVDPEEPFNYIFGTTHDEIEDQRQTFRENLKHEQEESHG